MDKNSAMPGGEPPVQENNINPEPVVAQVREDTVVVEATPVVMPEPQATTEPSENTVLIKPPKKKFSLAAIIGFVVFGLLLIGGIGFAIWYFAVYQNPQNVAFDAVNKFLSAESVQTKGQFTLNLDDEDDDTRFRYQIDLDNKSKTLPNAATATLSMSEIDESGSVIDDHTVSIDLGTAIMSDGAIYFQIANLTDAVDTIVTDDSAFKTEVGQAIYNVIELVDGEWWKISIPEIVDELDMGSSARPIKNLYSCIIDASKKDHSNEYAEYYRTHQFINVEKSEDSAPANGTSDYVATIDYDNLAGFLNELPRSEFSGEIMACYNTYAEATDGETVSPDDAETITAADLEKEMPEDLYIRLNISDFDHQLKSIIVGSDSSDYEFAGWLSFTYEPADVVAPDSYRPVTELVDEVMEIFMALFAANDGGVGDYYYYDPAGDLPNYDSAFGQTGV